MPEINIPGEASLLCAVIDRAQEDLKYLHRHGVIDADLNINYRKAARLGATNTHNGAGERWQRRKVGGGMYTTSVNSGVTFANETVSFWRDHLPEFIDAACLQTSPDWLRRSLRGALKKAEVQR